MVPVPDPDHHIHSTHDSTAPLVGPTVIQSRASQQRACVRTLNFGARRSDHERSIITAPVLASYESRFSATSGVPRAIAFALASAPLASHTAEFSTLPSDRLLCAHSIPRRQALRYFSPARQRSPRVTSAFWGRVERTSREPLCNYVRPTSPGRPCACCASGIRRGRRTWSCSI